MDTFLTTTATIFRFNSRANNMTTHTAGNLVDEVPCIKID